MNVQGQCEACPHNCDWCEDGICLECAQDYYIEDGGCVQECKKGNFGLDELFECESCPDECSACSSWDTCTECKKGYQLNDYEECEPCE